MLKLSWYCCSLDIKLGHSRLFKARDEVILGAVDRPLKGTREVMDFLLTRELVYAPFLSISIILLVENWLLSLTVLILKEDRAKLGSIEQLPCALHLVRNHFFRAMRSVFFVFFLSQNEVMSEYRTFIKVFSYFRVNLFQRGFVEKTRILVLMSVYWFL